MLASLARAAVNATACHAAKCCRPLLLPLSLTLMWLWMVVLAVLCPAVPDSALACAAYPGLVAGVLPLLLLLAHAYDHHLAAVLVVWG